MQFDIENRSKDSFVRNVPGEHLPKDEPDAVGEKVVRGGSFLDRPDRCRASARYSYPAWQKVHNVGFRIVVNEVSLASHESQLDAN